MTTILLSTGLTAVSIIAVLWRWQLNYRQRHIRLQQRIMSAQRTQIGRMRETIIEQDRRSWALRTLSQHDISEIGKLRYDLAECHLAYFDTLRALNAARAELARSIERERLLKAASSVQVRDIARLNKEIVDLKKQVDEGTGHAGY